MRKIRRKIEKVDEANADQGKTSMIVKEIRMFFNDETRFETNQELLSVRNVSMGQWLKVGQEMTSTPKRIENKTKQ